MAEIKGTIEIDGLVTEFSINTQLASGSGSWIQWAGTRDQLGARVDYLEAMAGALATETDFFQLEEKED